MKDKVALITGAGSGIGRATARLLYQQGARIGLLDLDKDEVHRQAEELNTTGGGGPPGALFGL